MLETYTMISEGRIHNLFSHNVYRSSRDQLLNSGSKKNNKDISNFVRYLKEWHSYLIRSIAILSGYWK